MKAYMGMPVVIFDSSMWQTQNGHAEQAGIITMVWSAIQEDGSGYVNVKAILDCAAPVDVTSIPFYGSKEQFEAATLGLPEDAHQRQRYCYAALPELIEGEPLKSISSEAAAPSQ